MSSLKLLYVAPCYAPAWAFGGVVTAASNLCSELAKREVNVTVYCTNLDGKGSTLDVPVNEKVKRNGVDIFYHPCTAMCSRAFYSRSLSDRIARSVEEFDIVHVSALWQYHQVSVYLACRKHGIPYIFSPHSSLMRWAFEDLGNTFYKKMYWYCLARRTVANASRIRFLSQGEAITSQKWTPNESAVVIPNGIDVNKYMSTQSPSRGAEKIMKSKDVKVTTDDRDVLLHLGRVTPKKNIHLILDAFSESIKVRDKFTFICIGSKDDRTYFERIKKMAPYDFENVVFLSTVDHKKVYEWYNAADLLVLPSEIEGVSMTVIEALSSRLPVLVSNRVANYTEIEEYRAGIVVKPELRSLIDGLLEFSKLPSSRKESLKTNAARLAKSEYAIDNVANRMQEELRNIVG